MKVKDLIKELKKVDPESIIVLQKDAEGNGYSPLSGIDNDAIYIPDSTWSGDMILHGHMMILAWIRRSGRN